MTSPGSADVLVLTNPDALVSGLSFLIGFPPVESAVLLWIAERRLLLTQRIDLPDAGSDLEPWLATMWSHLAATTADELVIVLVTGRVDADALIQRIRTVADQRGLPVRDALIVNEGRWRSVMCGDPACCDVDGRPVDPLVSARVAAEFTGAGVSPQPTREAIVGEFGADPVWSLLVGAAIAEQPAIRGADRERWREEVIEEFASRTMQRAGLDAEGAALVILGLDDVRIRDTILWDLSRADRASVFRALEILAACTRGAPRGSVAPVATCAGIAAWMVGDGARAQIAIERGLADRDDYSLALLVQHSIRVGLPPTAWADAMSGLTRNECRHGRKSNRARRRAS